jgi:excisionase family DNA binding protein
VSNENLAATLRLIMTNDADDQVGTAPVVAWRDGTQWTVRVLNRHGTGATLADAMVDAAGNLRGAYALSSPILVDERQPPATPLTDRYLTTHDVAAKLGMSQRKIEDMCKRRELPAAKFGRDWRIKASAFAEFLAQRFAPSR